MKGGQVIGQGGAAPSNPKGQAGQLTNARFEALATQTYLTAAEAACFTRRPSAHAFHQWATRTGLPKCRMGRAVLYRRRDIERAIDPQRNHQRAG